MHKLVPKRLAERQVEIDRHRTHRFPDLQARKAVRMSRSPLSFLRGAAPLFYEILRDDPDLAAGPPNEGWIVGDAHLENFGAYQTLAGESGKKVAVFDLDEFDEAVMGPWRWDALRLATGIILAGRGPGCGGESS